LPKSGVHNACVLEYNISVEIIKQVNNLIELSIPRSTESVADESIGVFMSTQILLFGNSVLRTKLAHANILQTK